MRIAQKTVAVAVVAHTDGLRASAGFVPTEEAVRPAENPAVSSEALIVAPSDK